MDIGALQTLIANMGFPIACVIAMFYMWNKEREDHKAEMEKVSSAIVNNTMALNTLVNLLNNEKEAGRHSEN